MNRLRILNVLLPSLLVVACGGDGPEAPNPVVPLADPPPPALGTQVDRMGRSAIATALVSSLADDATRGAALDAYNAAPQADWGNFTTQIRASLGAFDGLDGMCGNQILADLAQTGPERYDTFAGVLTDDRLYLNAASGACTQYLAVELDVTGLAGTGEDCGGRTPLYDTIDVSYTALSNDLSVPVGDGVASDDVTHSLDVFPFLAAP